MIYGKLEVTLNNDGSISTNATKLSADGGEAEVLKELQALATMLGGDLKVEKHVHGAGVLAHVHGGHTHTH